MPEKGEVIDSNYISSIENLNINDWTKIQMTKTLELLNGKKEDQPSFYSIEGEKVKYNMDVVKDYLTHLCKKEDGTLKTRKEMMDDMQIENKKAGLSYGVSTPWIMAIQIALEYLGYDIGKIDGNLGGETEKVVGKYQRNHNFEIDGQPGPEVIDSLLKDFQTVENNKEWGKVFGNKLKEYKLDKYFKINSIEGSIEITDVLLKIIEKGFNNKVTNDLQKILHLSDRIQKSSGYWAIHVEFCDDYRPYNLDFCDRDSCLNQINKLGTCLKYFKSSIKSVKLVPNYYSGYDAKITSIIKNTSNYKLKRLFSFGITMEDSKIFLDKYMETKNITSLDEISNYDDFFDEEMDPEMIEFLFGMNNDKIKSLSPIKIFDGLKFYKLKCLWGASKFKKRIIDMIDNGFLTKESKIDIGFLINVEPSELQTYFEICNYLKNLFGEGFFPDLEGYSPKEYLKIIKYMGEYSYYPLFSGIEIGEILLKNNIPKEAVNFFEFQDINWGFFDPVPLFKEIFEDENGKNLFEFLSKYPQKLGNLGGKEIKEIELTTKRGGYNFCFRGILEMIKSIPNTEIPNLKKDGEQKWKQGRERIIKEYEKLLRDYISLDKDANGNDIPKNQTFDKVFFANAVNHKDEDNGGVIYQGENKIDYILKSFTENFEDCSSVIDENGNIDQTNQKIMIETIRKYAMAHQNEKILVYLGYHGAENGCSSNGWSKDDRLELATISPNIKIISTRCSFGGAYTNISTDKNYIYGLQSPVSGFSNRETTTKEVFNILRQGYENLLGFHEMEIYARLHYNYSFTPLTEYMDYIDFRTGKKRRGLVGLADAGIGNERDDIA